MWINMLTLWITWFNLCEIDPLKLIIPQWLSVAGLIFFILGLLLFIIPLIQIRGVENVSKLCTTGVYKVLRHPMYLGFIFWVVGFPLFMKAQIALIAGIVFVFNILYWRYLEEKELLVTYPEYAAYKKETIF
jgi:protein-S-isoprenylcysteine O-methyltransferase Ste14